MLWKVLVMSISVILCGGSFVMSFSLKRTFPLSGLKTGFACTVWFYKGYNLPFPYIRTYAYEGVYAPEAQMYVVYLQQNHVLSFLAITT